MKLRKNIRQALKAYKDYRDANLTASEPFKALTYNLPRSYGRNNQGKITVRHIGGGAKRLYRDVSIKREILDQEGTVMTVEYDPYRTSWISLIKYNENLYEYILHCINLKVGDKVIASKNQVPTLPGCCTLIQNIPVGTIVHNVEIYPSRGGKISRSAGSFCEIIDHVDKYTIIKLPSGAMIKVIQNCYATIGQVSNIQHQNIILYKAGQNRHRNIRPTVRGVAMNPVDHPHGGGEGRTGTKRHPVSYTGKLTKGKKTANNKRPRRKLIIKQRKTNR